MSDDSSSNTTITLHLTVTASPGAPRVPLQLEKTASCTQLRQLASQTTHIPLSALKLIFRGRLIGDDATKVAMTEFKLENESVLHCMGKPEKTTATANDNNANAATTTGAAPAVATPVATTTAATTAPASAVNANTLDAALQNMRQSNAPTTFQTAVQTLQKILNNIIQNPMEEKYRRVKKQNAAFQKRLGGLPGAEAVMVAVGFVLQQQDGEPAYVLEASPEAWPQLLQAQTAVNQAVQQATLAVNQASAPPPPPQPMGAGAGGAGMQPPPPNDPMAAMAANLMSDPHALQSMMQNPMVQNMMRSDPRFAQIAPMMDQIANNPAMAQQLSQMMANPQMQQQIQQAMAAQGGGGMGGSGMFPNFMPPPQQQQQQQPPPPLGNFPNFMPPQASQQQQQQAPANQQQQDNEQTEEEMIAEAIRRSLQDSNNNNP